MGSTSTDRAFWTFDAVVTAARFHSTLPGVAPGWTNVVTNGIILETFGTTSYTLGGTVHIKNSDFDDWDTILHEYGHAVAQKAGFFVLNLSTLKHNIGENARIAHGLNTKALQLAFSEGWANFFSIVAQREQGVPFQYVTATNDPSSSAGDSQLYDQLVEGRTSLLIPGSFDSFGEDHELAVMRVLWDLYDPRNDDQVELGMGRLFRLLVDKHVSTADELNSALYLMALGDPKWLTNVDEVFAEHAMAPTNLQMLVSGNPVTNWGVGQPIPQFRWTIPKGALNVGNVLSNFRIAWVDGGYLSLGTLGINELVVGQGLAIQGNIATWTPNLAQWQTISAYANRIRYWSVGGGELIKDDLTGPFWSPLRPIKFGP